jgi:hypothetical protein
LYSHTPASQSRLRVVPSAGTPMKPRSARQSATASLRMTVGPAASAATGIAAPKASNDASCTTRRSAMNTSPAPPPSVLPRINSASPVGPVGNGTRTSRYSADGAALPVYGVVGPPALAAVRARSCTPALPFTFASMR